MSFNANRKLDRAQKKQAVDEFRKHYGYNKERMAGLCLIYKNPSSLNGQFRTVIELEIQMLEKKFDEQVKAETVVANEAESNG